VTIFEAKTDAAGDVLELLFYGVIGSSFWEDGISSKQVARALKENAGAKKIRIRLNSPGGVVDEGFAIRTTLQQHASGRHIEAHVDGLAASAASVIAMGADRIIMHEGTRMMIHEARKSTFGDKRDHARALTALDAANEGMADIYATRTGQTKEQVTKMMSDETWLTAAKAVELGFADELVKGKPPVKAAKVSAQFDLTKWGYRDTPEMHEATAQLRAMAELANEETEDEPMSNYARIAIALGLAESADENAILSDIDRKKTANARDKAAVAELCDLTGKQNSTEALGVARAHAQANDKLAEVRAELEGKDKQLESQEREGIFAKDDADPKGRKLTPKMREFWKGEPVAKLKAFMESAGYVAPAAPRASGGGGGKLVDDKNDTEASGKGGNGKSKYSDYTGTELQALKRENPERYRELREAAKDAGEI